MVGDNVSENWVLISGFLLCSGVNLLVQLWILPFLCVRFLDLAC